MSKQRHRTARFYPVNIKNLIDKHHLILLASILLASFFLYYPSLSFKFLMNFDDDILILSGPEAQSLSFENVKRIFSSPKYGLYHPFTSLTWNIEHHLFGPNPFYYHLNNLLLHLVNVVLVFVLIARFLKNKGIALFSALLFAIHPMHVENIVWLSSRKDLVYGIFFLLSLIQYLRYSEKKSKLNLSLAILFFVASLLSKANAIVLPIIFILIDWYQGRRDWGRVILSKIPLLAFSGLMVYITYSTQEAEGFIREIDGTFNFVDRFFLLTYSVFHYGYNLIAPVGISPKNFYPIKDGNLLPTIYYASAFILGLIAFLIYKSKHRKQLVFAVLFALIILFPVLKLVPTGNDLVSNRYAYMPYIMLYAIFGWIIFKGKTQWIKLITIALIPLFAFQSFNYQESYNNSIALWTKIIDTTEPNSPTKAMALNERGQVYYKAGNSGLAIKDINQALKIEPNLLRGLLNRANLYDVNNQFDLALKDLNKALEAFPESVEALKIRGVIYSKQNKASNAIADFNAAIAITPQRADLYNNRGIAYSIMDSIDLALKDFAKAIELENQFIDAYVNRANLYININQPTKAQEDLAIAYTANPNNFIYAYLIAKTHLMNGKPEKAHAFLEPFSRDELFAAKVGERLFADGYLEESLSYFSIAIGNESIREKSFYQRAQVYKGLGQHQNAIDDLMVIIEKMPGGQFFLEIANLYQELGNQEKACKFWNEGAIRDHRESKNMLDKYCD